MRACRLGELPLPFDAAAAPRLARELRSRISRLTPDAAAHLAEAHAAAAGATGGPALFVENWTAVGAESVKPGGEAPKGHGPSRAAWRAASASLPADAVALATFWRDARGGVSVDSVLPLGAPAQARECVRALANDARLPALVRDKLRSSVRFLDLEPP